MKSAFLEFIRSSEGFAREVAEQVPAPSAIIGSSLSRVDGPLKTTGTALYASDYNFPRMVYAEPVRSTIANGTIRSLDASVAEKMPGVLLVLHHGNIAPLFRVAKGGGEASESRPPFEDETISYWGQYVAVVIAETFQQAQAAAAAVRVTYDTAKPNVSTKLDDAIPAMGATCGPKVESRRGDAEAAFTAAAVQVDETYVTPVETHNPMEMHATVAVWDGQNFKLYESSQGVMNHLTVMAEILGVPKENVQVISRFIGSGFGGKLFPWPHSALAAAAARQLNRPVKLTLTRPMMFSNVGHRPRTQQRMRLGATAEGKLVSLQQDYRNHTSPTDDIEESCGEATPFLYSVANLQITSALVRRNVGTPTPMRGPGAVPGLFALESAMDELAIKLKQDPVALRLAHDTLIDEENKKPFSSRHLKECLETGATKFGWSRRTPEVGSMRKGDLILGWGVAAASWGAWRGGNEASVSLKRDGTVRVSSGTQDIGTGTYTVMAQIVADKTGVPVEKIEVVMGDSSLPPGAMSGGSTGTASIIPSLVDAVKSAVKVLLATAVQAKGSPYLHQNPATLTMTTGRIHAKDQSPESGVPFQDVLRMANLAAANGNGKSGGLGSDTKANDYSTHSFGAQFVEVEWDPGIAKLRVSRVVTVIDGGRIINKKTATNQIAGAVVMGVGMGLMEQTTYDPRNGHAVNDNFADYLVPTSADSPEIDVTFLDIPDPMMGEYGARGIGEIGLAGVAPAITAAVYHATGVRVRELPVRIEDLLTSRVTS
ncbi:xanthine dehydrogenase family protein molybdopterin-binding subunit [Granulicella arctica]|uniref:Xanthine dehydrogenase YagR molybdenum-binding subunit n=1 Tax=Granulicella arctica TaxID=940613 RepID=A0A7Y9PDR3_9BACT|nr:xanthine dehydrogenase family protein molybdopterin-binding subunit [Granulicella arctica]NYF78053.1 xanthine dehydrogenase YagR molybdenum-binding subunit [Granulicella arctica]